MPICNFLRKAFQLETWQETVKVLLLYGDSFLEGRQKHWQDEYISFKWSGSLRDCVNMQWTNLHKNNLLLSNCIDISPDNTYSQSHWDFKETFLFTY